MKSILVFDLDDTLIPSSMLYEQALQAIGLSSDDPGYLKARALTKSRLPASHVAARNRILYLKAWLEARGRPNPSALLQLMGSYEQALLDGLAAWEGLDAVQRLLASFREHYRLGLLTNENTRTQLLKLSVLDPKGEYFDVVVTSEEVGVEKPDPGIFKELETRLPGKSSTITLIGDSWETDLTPALSRGWKAVLMTQFLSPGDSEKQCRLAASDGRVVTIASLAELTYKLNH